MLTRVTLRHHTAHHYPHPVVLGPHTIRLRPRPHSRTPVSAYALTVVPDAHTLNWQEDAQANVLARVSFPEATTVFSVTVELTAELVELNPFDFFVEPEAVNWPFSYAPLLEQELAPCRAAEPVSPWLIRLLTGFALEPQPSVDLLVALNQLVRDRVSYVTRLEPGVQAPEQTVNLGSGSCRDMAWLLVQVVRSLGFAARFVSGYLIQLADASRPVAGIAADRADLHAWAEVYLPGAGWIGFDATSGLMTTTGHISLAASVQPASAAPITGTVGGADAEFDFDISITRISASGTSAVV